MRYPQAMKAERLNSLWKQLDLRGFVKGTTSVVPNKANKMNGLQSLPTTKPHQTRQTSLFPQPIGPSSEGRIMKANQ